MWGRGYVWKKRSEWEKRSKWTNVSACVFGRTALRVPLSFFI